MHFGVLSYLVFDTRVRDMVLTVMSNTAEKAIYIKKIIKAKIREILFYFAPNSDTLQAGFPVQPISLLDRSQKVGVLN